MQGMEWSKRMLVTGVERARNGRFASHGKWVTRLMCPNQEGATTLTLARPFLSTNPNLLFVSDLPCSPTRNRYIHHRI